VGKGDLDEQSGLLMSLCVGKRKGRDKRGPSFREETPKTASGPKYVTNVDPFQQDFAVRMAGMRQKQ
jgi:hypothetical protein